MCRQMEKTGQRDKGKKKDFAATHEIFTEVLPPDTLMIKSGGPGIIRRFVPEAAED